MSRLRWSAIMLVTLAWFAVACGGDDATATPPTGDAAAESSPGSTAETSPPTDGGEAAFPVTVELANGPLTLAEEPARIVSLSPTATENLFAIGAGDQVVAVDDQSTYPEAAPRTDLSGFTPNLEAIAAYEPDLVVVSDDIDDVIAGLALLDVPTAHFPAPDDLDGALDQILDLGRLTGHADEARSLVDDMSGEIDDLIASLPERPTPLTYYHELDDTLYSVTSETFIGQVYALVGMENIADAAADAASLYPQLSAELILESDPDLILLADTKCCGQSAATLAQRPGWDGLTAVAEGRVVELDDDVASRWGPRLVDLVRAVVEVAAEIPAG